VVLREARSLADQGKVHWREVQETFSWRVLFPLLHSVLADQDWVPEDLRRDMVAAYRLQAARNALLLTELDGLVELLEARGLGVIVLKGAALAEAVYGNAALRPMTDLDLLIRREDLPMIVDLLAQEGYQLDATLDTHDGMSTAYENELILKKPGLTSLMVELHWTLLNSPYYQERLPVEWFWETASPSLPLMAAKGAGNEVAGAGAKSKVAANDVRVLGPEALVLYLCAHLELHHKGEGLLWLNDVAEVLYHFRDQLDWDLILSKGPELELVLSLQNVLPRVVEGWGAPVPPWALERLRDLRPSVGEVRVFNWLLAAHRPVIQRFWADLSSMSGWGVRVRYALGSLFPARAYMIRRYRIRHPLLTPVYYPYRWFRGLQEAVLKRDGAANPQIP
jgi:hypothetical protein